MVYFKPVRDDAGPEVPATQSTPGHPPFYRHFYTFLHFPRSYFHYMVEAKATWLYELPQWDAILTPEKRKELYKSQKASGTVRKAKKIFPNDPCPCGSGKKYKKCCGKNA